MPAQTAPGAAPASPPSAKTEDVTADVPSTAVRLKGGVGDEMFEGMLRREGGEERVDVYRRTCVVIPCHATREGKSFILYGGVTCWINLHEYSSVLHEYSSVLLCPSFRSGVHTNGSRLFLSVFLLSARISFAHALSDVYISVPHRESCLPRRTLGRRPPLPLSRRRRTLLLTSSLMRRGPRGG